jgi:hypothetical protein
MCGDTVFIIFLPAPQVSLREALRFFMEAKV